MSFLNDVEKHLDLPPGPKSEVIRELTSHYEDIREELLASGTPETQVDEEVERRLGSPVDVAARLSAVHNVASWKSAVMFTLPLFIPLLVKLIMLVLPYITPSALAQKLQHVDGYYMEAVVTWTLYSIWLPGVLKALIRGTRPVWLTSWFATTVILANAAYFRVMPLPTISPLSLIVAVYGLVLLWKREWKWSIAAIVLVALNLGGASSFLGGITFINIQWFYTSALAVFLAFRVFVLHSYGGVVSAILFLWCCCALHGPGYTFMDGYEYLGDQWSVVLMAALLGFVYTKAPNLRQKKVLLGTWLLVVTLMPCIGSALYHGNVNDAASTLGMVLISITLPISFVLAVPLIYDYAQRVEFDPPEIVQ